MSKPRGIMDYRSRAIFDALSRHNPVAALRYAALHPVRVAVQQAAYVPTSAPADEKDER